MVSRSVYQVYGETPTRQLQGLPMVVSESGHTGKQTNLLHAVTHVYGSPPYARKPASQAVPSRVQLTLRAILPTRHGASRLVCTGNVCLVGENSTCSVPELS